MYRDVKEATTKYYDELLVNNGTKHSIEAKIFGNQDGVDKKFIITFCSCFHHIPIHLAYVMKHNPPKSWIRFFSPLV